MEGVSAVVDLLAQYLNFEDPRFASLEAIYAGRLSLLSNPTGPHYRRYTALLRPENRGDVEALERLVADVDRRDSTAVVLTTGILDLWGETPRSIARSTTLAAQKAAAASAGLDPTDAEWLLDWGAGYHGEFRSRLAATLCLNPATPDRIVSRVVRTVGPASAPDASALLAARAWRREGWVACSPEERADRISMAHQYLVGSAFDRRMGDGGSIDHALSARLLYRYAWFVTSGLLHASSHDPAVLAPVAEHNWRIRPGVSVDTFLSRVTTGRAHEILTGGEAFAEKARQARTIAETLGEDPAAHRILAALSATWTGSIEDLVETVCAVRSRGQRPATVVSCRG